jgi:hypothetical protein
MRKMLAGIVGSIILAGSTAVLRADALYNFEDIPQDTRTTFLYTNNGVTATFSSSIPGTYLVDVNPDGVGSGQRLIQDAATTGNNIQLTVSFGGQQFQAASFAFGILAVTTDNPAPQLTLEALLNGTPVASAVAGTTTDYPLPPDFPFYSAGLMNFNPGTAFDSLVFTSNHNGLAIDDLFFSSSAISGVPEPASIALLMFGMAGLLAFVRSRQQRSASVRCSPF